MKSFTSPTTASDKSNESARPRSKPASSCASQPAPPASTNRNEQQMHHSVLATLPTGNNTQF